MARGAATNGEGTLVDTIYYESTGVTLTDAARTAFADENHDGGDDYPETKVGKIKIPVEVRLRKHFATDTGKNRPVDEMIFMLICKEPSIKLKGTDIEVLRAAMWAELDKENAIKWEHHMLITIEPAMNYGQGISEGLRLVEESVWKGTTKDGMHLLRQTGHNRLDQFGDVYKPWPGQFVDKRGRVTACIPATKENQDAIEAFRVKIREMRERLKDLVRPDQILATLANLSEIALIAGETNKQIEDQRS